MKRTKMFILLKWFLCGNLKALFILFLENFYLVSFTLVFAVRQRLMNESLISPKPHFHKVATLKLYMKTLKTNARNNA